MSGKHIELLLVDGTPGGLTTAEILNWTGQVLSAPQAEMSALVRRAELAGTCVYLLLEQDDQGGTRCCRRDRLLQDTPSLPRRKQGILAQGRSRYLEGRQPDEGTRPIPGVPPDLARDAGRPRGARQTERPPAQALPEAHASDMNYFIEQLQIVLPVLGIDAIRGRETVVVPATRQEQLVSLVFHLANRKFGVAAMAQQIDGEFTMLAGSTVVADWQGVGKADSTIKAYESYRAQHLKLIADGSIIVENSGGRVAKDIVLGSPSTAGAIAQGRSCNGRSSWVTEDGSTFGSSESRGVNTTEGS